MWSYYVPWNAEKWICRYPKSGRDITFFTSTPRSYPQAGQLLGYAGETCLSHGLEFSTFCKLLTSLHISHLLGISFGVWMIVLLLSCAFARWRLILSRFQYRLIQCVGVWCGDSRVSTLGAYSYHLTTYVLHYGVHTRTRYETYHYSFSAGAVNICRSITS